MSSSPIKKNQRLQIRQFLQTVWYESKRARPGRPPLVMGLIQVRTISAKFFVSPVGARLLHASDAVLDPRDWLATPVSCSAADQFALAA
jgi:hypothetical protein